MTKKRNIFRIFAGFLAFFVAAFQLNLTFAKTEQAKLDKIQQNCSIMTFFCEIYEGKSDSLPEIFL